MRDAVLLVALVTAFGYIFRYPFAGVLAWGWLSLMIPQSYVFGFLHAAPVNFGLAAQTLGLWLVSKDGKRLPADPLPILMLLLVAWMVVNSMVAPYPDWSADKFALTMKTYPFIFICLLAARSKARILALVWVLVASLGFYGVKGGAFTLATGGNYHVMGESGIYYDNNQLALALVMGLPLVHYLWETTANRRLRTVLLATLVLQTVSVLGSYSRGGIIALCAMLGVFWLRSRRKLLYLTVGAAVVGAGLAMMPEKFFARMDTIGHAEQDRSFMGRVQAWQVCTRYAVDHFPFGSGFNGNFQPQIYHTYFPGAVTHAAHSIFFEVLGDHGFPGLVLYAAIALVALRNARLVARACGGRPELAWAGGLASALEVAQIAFYVGGSSLSVAYWDGILLVQALTSALRALVLAPQPLKSRGAALAPPAQPAR